MKEKKKIIVNAITSLRLLATLLIAPIYFAYGGVVASAVIAGFFLTDFIDGKLARKWHVQTFLGSLLDTISDKTLAVSSLLTLSTVNPLYTLPLLMEIGIFAVNKAIYQEGQNIQANIIGKAKAWLLGAGITFGFLSQDIAKLTPISENAIKNLNLASTLIPTIACGATLASYCYSYYQARKENKEIEELEAELADIQQRKTSFELEKKSKSEIWQNLIDTEFYLAHKDEPIMQLLYKPKKSN